MCLWEQSHSLLQMTGLNKSRNGRRTRHTAEVAVITDSRKPQCFCSIDVTLQPLHAAVLEPSWNVMAHGDAREGKWRGNWRMEWVASTPHTTSEHGVSSITTADAHTSAASSRLNWRPRRFKWIRPFRRKTKSGFCACAVTFQLIYTKISLNGAKKKCCLHRESKQDWPATQPAA